MTDVSQLVAALESDEGYAEGTARFPRRIKRAEAADVADNVHDEIEAASPGRAAAASEAGTPLACGEGCNYCCEELIMVAAPEEATVARWLADAAHREAREAFLAAYPAWRERAGDTPERLADATARGDMKAHRALYLEHYASRIMCPFNREGLCTIYDVRPIGCRNAHAVGTAELCRGDNLSGVDPQRFPFVPVDRLIDRGHGLMRAAHHAMRAPRGRPVCLAVSVYERLTGGAEKAARAAAKSVGRNDPCPCGSGVKYKRCCGR